MALIDQIADQCGLFISDLKAQDNYSVIAEVLTQIDPDSFPVTDWNHFITYLFEKDVAFTSSSQARQTCLEQLNQK